MAKIWRYATWSVTVLLLILILNMHSVFMQADPALSAVLQPATTVIPNNLFSLNIINLEYGAAWPTVPFKGWRNFYTDWSILEPSPGVWNFSQVDSEVALAQQHGSEMMLILVNTPTWASARPTEVGCCDGLPWRTNGNTAEARNIEDWKNYVRTLAQRYKGRVRYYELWNEPNVPRFYSGTITELVKLNQAAYQVLKEVDPTITVVSSALSTGGEHLKYFENYLAQGGGNYADVIGYHFYVAPAAPETMLSLIEQVKLLMTKYGVGNKPLWNTETGWKIVNSDRNLDDEQWAGGALSDSDSSAYLARSYILSWASGVQRLYWYAWGHRSMGLTNYDAVTPKPIATAYNEVQKWMVGSKMVGCSSDQQGTWICQLQRYNVYSGWIVWNPNQTLQFSLPKAWRVKQVRDLSGAKRSISGAKGAEIGPSPLIFEWSA